MSRTPRLTSTQRAILERLYYDGTYDDEQVINGIPSSEFDGLCGSPEAAKRELENLRRRKILDWIPPDGSCPDHTGGYCINMDGDAYCVTSDIAHGTFDDPSSTQKGPRIRFVEMLPSAARKPQGRPERGIVRVLVVILLLALGFFAWVWIARSPRSSGPGGLPGAGPATRDMYGLPVSSDPKPEPSK